LQFCTKVAIIIITYDKKGLAGTSNVRREN